jgi:preprotein translocase subunit SecA
VRAPARVEQRRHAAFVARVNACGEPLRALSEPAFQSRLKDVRARLAASSFADEATAEAFALVREATRRQLGLAHYDTQLIAGKIMLGNQLAEMATGEGKTLAAALDRHRISPPAELLSECRHELARAIYRELTRFTK